MPIREITAPETKFSVGFIRSEIGDLEKRIYLTDDEIINKLNSAIKDICNDTLCLEETIKFKMVPDAWQYSVIELLDTTYNIRQVKNVGILDSSGSPVCNAPNPVSLQLFNSHRKRTEITTPKIYCFDGLNFNIWKPYSVPGYWIEVDCSREYSESDYAGYDTDPPTVIKAKYMEYARMGAIYHAIASKPILQESLSPDYYYKEFMKYKTKGSVSPHYENETNEFNELNIY